MGRSVGAYEAKAHLSQLLDEVSAGNTITITRHGVPAALLVPAPDNRQSSLADTIDRILADRKGRAAGDISIRELIEEGRL